MTLEDAKNLMMCRCQIEYEGMIFAYIESITLYYDRQRHGFYFTLDLKDRMANCIVRAKSERCVPIPLDPEE